MTMDLNNKFVRRMFRRIDGLVWDAITGKVGVKTAAGIHNVDLSGEQPVPTVNPFDTVAIELPAFATQVARENIKKGDLIVGDNSIIGWVVDETLPVALRVMDHNGNTKTYTAPNVAVMGSQGVLVVQNLFNLAGGEVGAGNLVNNMLPLLMFGGGEDKLDSLFPFLLAQSTTAASTGGAGAVGGMNPMLMMALMSKKGGSGGGLSGLLDDPLMAMMMFGGMGGGAGGMNPMLMMALMGDSKTKPAATLSTPVKPSLTRL